MQTRRKFAQSAIAGAVLASRAQSSTAADKVMIVPRPRFLDVRSPHGVELGPNVPIVWGKSLFGSEYRWSAQPLQRKLRGEQSSDSAVVASAAVPIPLSLQFCPGHAGYVVSSPDMALPSPCILIGSPADHDSLRKLSGRLKPKLGLKPEDRLGEAYLLSAGSQGLHIVADTPGGAFYAVQTVLQALGSERMMPGMDVADAPASPFRGLHFNLNEPEWIPTLQRLVREVLPRYKTNTVIAGINYRFRFRSYPEINEQVMLDASHARELANVCQQNNVRLIPLINCYGHQSSARLTQIHGLLRAYPQFNETPCKKDALFYNWCPSDPRIPPIVNALIDELITAFESDAIHLGMDEVLELAQCQFCRDKSPGELFAKVANEFHEHVVGKRKVQMIIWADRLIDGRKTPYNPMNGSRVGTHTALSMIPKDIFLCDWHYHLHETYPSVEMFAEAGFDFVACGWQNKEAIRAFVAHARKHGGRHYRGYLATNWSPFVRIAQYLLDGTVAKQDAAAVRNFAECYRLGMELAWSGA